MTHPALTPGRTAVITGGASGIGLAAARRFAGLGLNLVLADLPGERLEAAAAMVRELGVEVLAVATDVADRAAVEALRGAAYDRFGEVGVLMNNAGVGRGGAAYERYDDWSRVLGVNLWGVINGVQAFVPAMLAQGTPGLVINTGSKQGITTPPGDTAYNVSKAGVKALTEGLEHSLRNAEGGRRITAHLLVPGFTWTGITGGGRTEQPPGAWSADQVVDFMMAALERGDFYILCPDNETSSAMDRARIEWAAQDLTQNRPPLSRWHPEWKDAFAAFMAERLG